MTKIMNTNSSGRAIFIRSCEMWLYSSSVL